MRLAHLAAALLMLSACSFDSTVSTGGGNGVVPDLGDGSVLGADGADEDAMLADECAGQTEGATCSDGICLGGACLTSDTTELKGSNLTIVDSDSTRTDWLDNSLDEISDSRWPTDPDELPIYISFQFEQAHYIAGVHVEAGNWTHCAESDIFVSTDGVNWGSPVASYSQVDPLPTGEPAYFASPALGEFVKIVVNRGANSAGYCYISIFRAIAVGL